MWDVQEELPCKQLICGSRAAELSKMVAASPMFLFKLTKRKCNYKCSSLLVVVQLLSHVQLFVTLWTAAHQASLSFTISQSLPKPVHWISDAIQPSHPSLPPSSPFAFWLSQDQGLFQRGVSSHQVAKVLELQLQQQFHELCSHVWLVDAMLDIAYRKQFHQCYIKSVITNFSHTLGGSKQQKFILSVLEGIQVCNHSVSWPSSL